MYVGSITGKSVMHSYVSRICQHSYGYVFTVLQNPLL